MIRSFKTDAAEALWRRERPRGVPPDLHTTAYRKLLMLHAATRLEDLRVPPGNRLEALKGDRAGQYSIRINDQWRFCFSWNDGVENLELVDDHS
jgi:proteic killer suppression protein